MNERAKKFYNAMSKSDNKFAKEILAKSDDEVARAVSAVKNSAYSTASMLSRPLNIDIKYKHSPSKA